MPTATAVLLALLLASLIAGPAAAQGLAVAPISIEFGPEQRTSTIGITNRTENPVTVQIRTFAWSERDNRDELTPSDTLVASPPFAQVAPGQSQTIRLVLRQAPGGSETTYRLLVDEIPPPATRTGIRVALRFSVPVFVPAQTTAAPDLAWSLIPGQPGATLVARNRGNRHTRILSAELGPAGAAPIPLQSVVGAYVLAGAERSWPLPNAAALRGARSLTLRAQSDQGPVEARVTTVP